jgi:membrane protein
MHNDFDFSEPWRIKTLIKVPLLAGALAFKTILAIVPILGLSVWYLRSIGFISRWADGFKQFIFDQLNVTNSNALVGKVEKFIGGVQTNSWGWIGLCILIYTAMSLLLTLGKCFDILLETRGGKEKSRGVWAGLTVVRRMIALPLIPVFLAGSVAVMSWLKKDSLFRFLLRNENVGPWMAKPLPWMLDWIGFLLIYYMIPREKIAVRYAARAAFLATPLYEGGKWAMQIYAKNSFANAKLYGALAVIPIFMIWIQWAWMIVLGAVVCFPGPKKQLS